MWNSGGPLLNVRTLLMSGMLVVAAACGQGSVTTTQPPTEDGAPTEDGGSRDTPTSDEAFEFKYAGVGPEQTIFGQVPTWYFEELEERTGGRVKVELFHGESLIGQADILAALEDGRADFGALTLPFVPDRFPLWNVRSLPFVTSDGEAAMSAIRKLSLDEDGLLGAEFESNGVVPLVWLPVGNAINMTSQPADSLEALSGLRLRSAGLVAQAVEEAGATTSLIATAEIYESLQRGVIDGVAGYVFDTGVALGFHEVAPAITDPGMGQYTASLVAMSLDAWNSLPPDIQDVMIALSEEGVGHAVGLLNENEEVACDQLQEAGGDVTLSKFSDQEVAGWQEVLGDSLTDAWLGNAVDSGVPESEALAFLDDYVETVKDLEGDGVWVDGLARCQELIDSSGS